MNNNTEEAYCSFECAKLLKEKGFDVKCRYWFDVDGTLWNYNANTWNSNDGNITNFLCTKPTHAVAMEWIRINFGKFISITTDDNHQFRFEIISWRWDEREQTYRVSHTVLGETFWDTTSPARFNSPQEAVEAALLYVLKNLI